MPVIINALNPANTIASSGELIWTDRFKFDPRATLHFRFKRLNPHALQRVFGFGIFTIGSVTPVTLSCHDGFGHRQRMLQRQIAKLARRAGVGFLVAVFDRKPTAHQQVEAYQLAVFGDCHEVHVVGMQIDIVLRRDHYRGFELTRQVGLTKDRFFISSGDFFLVEPDLRIRAGTRQQMLRNLLRPLVRFRVQLRLVRVRGAEYVTVHVVSCRQRIKTDRVQHLVHRFDVLFQNAVELKRLAVGQANAAIDGVFTGKFIDRLPLFGGDHATRQTTAQQHRMARLQLLFSTFGADVAVILLIHAVEADQQEVIALKAAGQTVV